MVRVLNGTPEPDDFELVSEPVPEPGEGEMLLGRAADSRPCMAGVHGPGGEPRGHRHRGHRLGGDVQPM